MKGTVVIIANVPWHFSWQTVHNFAAGLAGRDYQVLVVEPLPKRWPTLAELGRVKGRLTGDLESAGLCVQAIPPGVELIAPRIVPDVGSAAQWLNRQFFVPGIADQIKYKAKHRPLIVINYLPTSASLALMAHLEPDVAFYHCVYDWTNDPHSNSELPEEEMVHQVDMIWADSPINLKRISAMNVTPRPLTKGVDMDLFSQAQAEPKEPVLERPLCAYFGTIGLAVNVNLLREVSHHFPLRLIGPSRSPLNGFSDETEIVGAVEHAELPALLQDVDVLLLPYLDLPHMDGVLPAKLFECLATGKPPIVMGLSSLEEYADLFYICETEDMFLDAIAQAVHEPISRRSARILCAQQNSYDHRLDEIERYIEEVLESRKADALLPAVALD